MKISIGKKFFTVFSGKISNDSYNATIKKLALLGKNNLCQIIPAKIVAGKFHLKTALARTIAAIDSGVAFSQNPNIEFIVRVLGERQISKAIDKSVFGNEDLLLVIEENNKNKINEIIKLLDFEEKKQILEKLGNNKAELMKIYEISEDELNSVKDVKNNIEMLVVEKTAFVTLEK
jgi:tRNA threonylcarbamoyladenosine modification (KEOPS) complex Cgi121 subunit